jgi:hypothetical protein
MRSFGHPQARTRALREAAERPTGVAAEALAPEPCRRTRTRSIERNRNRDTMTWKVTIKGLTGKVNSEWVGTVTSDTVWKENNKVPTGCWQI